MEFDFGAEYEQPPQQPTDNPLLTRAGQTLFTKGEFVSPNYKKGTSGWMVDEFGNVEFNDGVFRGDVTLGSTIRTVDTADEIQDAIDEVSADGGGSIYLAPGTYNMTSHIDIPSNVYLIGASRSAVIIDFGNAAFGVRSIGTVGTHIVNILVKDLTIQNSSITGLKLQYNDVSLINGVDVTGCNIGIEMDNVDSVAISGMGVLCDGNATNIKITNSVSFSVYFSAAINSTSGHGLELSSCSSATIFDSQFADNTGDGVNITSCSNIGFVSLAVSGNGGQGVEFVSGNNDLQWSHTVIDSNTSDGIKLTATTDRVHFSSITSSNNGGYGINIAAATCDNNTLVGISYVANSSGTLNDSGTGTVVISSNSINVQTFTSSNTWTKPGNGTIAFIQVWGGGGSGGRGEGDRGGGGGGGGAYTERWVALSVLGGTETVTIGAGGTAVTVNSTNGNAGGTTTFGSQLSAFGGGGGHGLTANTKSGGGGGGAFAVGTVGGSTTGGLGGSPSITGSIGTGGTTGIAGKPNTDGGGGGGGDDGASPGAGGPAVNGGGGGGGGLGGGAQNTTGVGGNSLNGGGGGGGAGGATGGASGGTSTNGGNGGAGGYDAVAATAGTQPAGGGGGSETGNSGAGGAGKVIVTVF